MSTAVAQRIDDRLVPHHHPLDLGLGEFVVLPELLGCRFDLGQIRHVGSHPDRAGRASVELGRDLVERGMLDVGETKRCWMSALRIRVGRAKDVVGRTTTNTSVSRSMRPCTEFPSWVRITVVANSGATCFEGSSIASSSWRGFSR